ncbi:unnamed protein product, partial [Owenia fusiformis]
RKMAASSKDLNFAWNVISSTLSPVKDSISSDYSDRDVETSVDVLRHAGISHIIAEWFLETIKKHLRQTIAPTFWSNFEHDPSASQNCYQLAVAINALHQSLMDYESYIQKIMLIQQYLSSHGIKMCSNVKERCHVLYRAIIFNSCPIYFQDIVNKFYTQAFKVFHRINQEEDTADVDEGVQCAGCEDDKETCQCSKIMETFHTVNRQLNELGLLQRISGEAVTRIIHKRIEEHIDETCKGNFESTFLETLEKWLETKVLGWLLLVYNQDDDKPSNQPSSKNQENAKLTTKECIEAYKGRLMHFLYETYANVQISQLFNIIIEYPDSEPALIDLKACLEKTDLRGHLVESLRTALETRLLHPGVNTDDILVAYISAIRALRVLDPTGVILELVCEPVRKYLRSREDTVRCIVFSLTNDGCNELSEELVKGHPLVLDESYHSDDESDDWENWSPDPVDADPAKTSKSRRTSDIISMLVNIYGSKELFVNEYRTLLADRILTQYNYDTEKEIRYLELLKLRFGETQLHYCEVMLKDVADSKRINTHIMEKRGQQPKAQEDKEDEIPVNSMVLSAQFWPSFREEKVELPEIMQKSLETYTKSYEALKGNRTLDWKPHLGLMNIEIELKDRKLNMNVSPVHATILMHFQEKSRWSVEELSGVMHMASSTLRRKITFWQSQGLLKEETTDTFVLVEEHKGKTHEVVIEDEEVESAMASSEAQREEELQVYWSYIVGMLTNLETLPIDRIHSMLKMFAMQGPTTAECTIQELKAFLDRKVKEQKLLFTGGVYRLPKPGS